MVTAAVVLEAVVAMMVMAAAMAAVRLPFASLIRFNEPNTQERNLGKT